MKTPEFSNVLSTPQGEPDDCHFCRPRAEEILDRNALGVTLIDVHPVVEGHCILIPERHAPTWFDLSADEVLALFELSRRAQQRLMAQDDSITGFNLGTNAAPSAGQSVYHCHLHLFPRRDGDQEDPRGGVRKIFPQRANYDRSFLKR